MLPDEEGKALPDDAGSWSAAWERASGGDSASGRPTPHRRVTVDTTEARKLCRKCDKWSSKKHPIYRHHMGCDSYVGIWNKGILYNYRKWLDCVDLCEDCHCEIHFIYEPYIGNWINRTARGAVVMRAKLIEVCREWLAGKIKTPKIPAGYKKDFHRSLLAWQKRANQATG